MLINRCIGCAYVGQKKTITKGSIWIEILLWLALFPVGLVYSVWRLCSRYRGCPDCKCEYFKLEEESQAVPRTRML